ncbi:MAG: hypothetical protein P1U70_24400 [Saprospiraceae bacterium]|jgi:hypothetical protein|nr:hypothetical protein [Saprospiraceae bacterium]
MKKYIIPPTCSVITLSGFNLIDIEGGAIGIMIFTILVIIIFSSIVSGLKKWFDFEL